MSEQRYTLSLPAEIYEELRQQADRRGMSIKEVVRQCLKFGLLAMKIDEDPNTELIIQERQVALGDANGSATVKETRLKFL